MDQGATRFPAGRRLTVIVPCFNEEGTVAELLQRVRAVFAEAELIVVDDASTDDTAQRIRQVQDELDVLLLELPHNGGKGAAVRAGLARATREWVVIQDADLEYDPADLARMLEIAERDNRDVVYGSRYQSNGHVRGGSWLNYAGVQFLAVLEWLLFGRWLSDPHTCYKMVRRRLLAQLDLQSDGFELCAEINCKLLRRGTAISEIPIAYKPRSLAEGKKIRLSDFFVAIKTYLKFRLTDDTVASGSQLASSSKTSAWFYAFTRLGIGMLLLFAGLFKLSPVSGLALTSWLVLPKTAVAGWGAMEFLIGWACLTLAPHRLLHRVVTVLFAMFLIILAIQAVDGEERCQCLGSFSLPLAAMAIIDLVAFASLIGLRRFWSEPLWLPAGVVTEQLGNIRVVIPVLLLIGVGWFGSLDAAYGFLSGKAILVDATHKFAGEVPQSKTVDVSYVLQNLTSQPVRVLGAKASCSCLAILDLPVTIEPGREKAIRIRVKGRTPNRVQRESAELVFDDSALRITLNATAVVRPNQE